MKDHHLDAESQYTDVIYSEYNNGASSNNTSNDQSYDNTPNEPDF
jgi:hypothetical protein